MKNWIHFTLLHVDKNEYVSLFHVDKKCIQLERELLTGDFTPFSSLVWSSKHGKICKRAEIHSVSSPKSGGFGTWDQANRAHFRVYFYLSATYFIFPTYDATTELIKKFKNLPKFLGGKGIQTPGKTR